MRRNRNLGIVSIPLESIRLTGPLEGSSVIGVSYRDGDHSLVLVVDTGDVLDAKEMFTHLDQYLPTIGWSASAVVSVGEIKESLLKKGQS